MWTCTSMRTDILNIVEPYFTMKTNKCGKIFYKIMITFKSKIFFFGTRGGEGGWSPYER